MRKTYGDGLAGVTAIEGFQSSLLELWNADATVAVLLEVSRKP